MKTKILLVGNGPCVFDSERGQEIDDFDGKIVRFNHFEIGGYEKYIGTRTDILVLGQLNIIEQLKSQYDYILLYQSSLDGGKGLRKIKKLSPHNEIKFFPLTEKDKIKELIELSRNKEPTTGIIAAYWFTRKDIDLYIYGFDFNTYGGEYFRPEIIEQDIKCHDSAKEAIYIEFLIEKNIMRWF
jgi:hypothetical protein